MVSRHECPLLLVGLVEGGVAPGPMYPWAHHGWGFGSGLLVVVSCAEQAAGWAWLHCVVPLLRGAAR